MGFSDVLPLTMTHNSVGELDQWIFSSSHLYTPSFDPEGIMSTLPAIGTVLLGNLMGYCLVSSNTNQNKFRTMLILAGILMGIGWIWSYLFPFNKSMWTSSYVLWTGGLSYLVYAGCFKLIEMHHYRLWSKPFLLLGKNAMLVYFLHVLFLKIQAMILIHEMNGGVMNLRQYITVFLFGNFKPQNASLFYALSYLIFWIIMIKYFKKWQFYGKRSKMFLIQHFRTVLINCGLNVELHMRINITGIPKENIILALFNNVYRKSSESWKTSMFIIGAGFSLTKSEVKSILAEKNGYVDSIRGVSFKMDFSADEIDVTDYDQLHGTGTGSMLTAESCIYKVKTEYEALRAEDSSKVFQTFNGFFFNKDEGIVYCLRASDIVYEFR